MNGRSIAANTVVVRAVVKRETTQQIKILFGKKGHGDDIVDQWGDRLIEGMKATVACTVKSAQDGELPVMLRFKPQLELADRYYHKMYSCVNCDWMNLLWFLKQRRAPASVSCEKCECDTAAPVAECETDGG